MDFFRDLDLIDRLQLAQLARSRFPGGSGFTRDAKDAFFTSPHYSGVRFVTSSTEPKVPNPYHVLWEDIFIHEHEAEGAKEAPHITDTWPARGTVTTSYAPDIQVVGKYYTGRKGKHA